MKGDKEGGVGTLLPHSAFSDFSSSFESHGTVLQMKRYNKLNR